MNHTIQAVERQKLPLVVVLLVVMMSMVHGFDKHLIRENCYTHRSGHVE